MDEQVIIGIVVFFILSPACCIAFVYALSHALSHPEKFNEKEIFKNKFKDEIFVDSDGYHIFKKSSSAIPLKYKEIKFNNYRYVEDTPHLRTISMRNVSTTEYVDNSGWVITTGDNSGKYEFLTNYGDGYKVAPNIFITQEMYTLAQEAGIPRLKTKNGKYYISLCNELYFVEYYKANTISHQAEFEKKYIESLPTFAEAIKIYKFIKSDRD